MYIYVYIIANGIISYNIKLYQPTANPSPHTPLAPGMDRHPCFSHAVLCRWCAMVPRRSKNLAEKIRLVVGV